MTDEQTPEAQLAASIKDEKFREEMRQRTDPNATQWQALDQSVQKQEKRVSEYSHEIDKRKNLGPDLLETERQLSDAQDARDAHLAMGRPGIFSRKEREAYDTELTNLAGDVSTFQKHLVELARKSDPERIEQLQVRMQEKQQALQESLEQRQGIAKLPSEEQGASQKAEDKQRAPFLMQDQIEKAMNAWSPDVRLEAREKQEDLNWTRQLEQDQQAVRQQVGRNPTDEEMHAYQAERKQQQTKQGQRSAQGM